MRFLPRLLTWLPTAKPADCFSVFSFQSSVWTFEFLAFTHYWRISPNGNLAVKMTVSFTAIALGGVG
jgi:hypothetical protein